MLGDKEPAYIVSVPQIFFDGRIGQSKNNLHYIYQKIEKYSDSNHPSSQINTCEYSMEEEQQGLDSIELYLRALKKKVEHQMKNPFMVNLTSYSFEQLNNWNNNILQLDATAKLYGQRVDFLHTGALQIMGTAIHIDQQSDRQPNAKETKQNPEDVKMQDRIDENPIMKNLQTAKKLNGQFQKYQTNVLLWRQIMKKRDTLPKLMLNQLIPNNQLMLLLSSSSEDSPPMYQSVFADDSVYLKMFNFSGMSTQHLLIFQEIEEMGKDLDMYILSMNKKGQNQVIRENIEVDTWMEFDFPFQNISSFNKNNADDHQYNSDTDSTKTVQNPGNYELNPIPQLNDDDSEYEANLCSNASFFTINTEDTSSPKKKKQKNQQKGEKKKRKINQEYIDFMCLNPLKSQILKIQPELNDKDDYICNKDHLMLKFIKYPLPFTQRPKNKAKRSFRRMTLDSKHCPRESDTFNFLETNQMDLTTQVNNFSQNIRSKVTAIKFKEAALPIKQLKKKIRSTYEFDGKVTFQNVKNQFRQEEPLDIFISVLHIAAEDGLLIEK